jgi:hypothetical protein
MDLHGSGDVESGKGYTLRRSQKDAEVTDGQRVAEGPLCRYGCKLQKRKELQVTVEIKELVTGEEAGIGPSASLGMKSWHFETPLEARGKQCE